MRIYHLRAKEPNTTKNFHENKLYFSVKNGAAQSHNSVKLNVYRIVQYLDQVLQIDSQFDLMNVVGNPHKVGNLLKQNLTRSLRYGVPILSSQRVSTV